ncbi:MAG: response regulator [Defluviitaleaceae bacterium]|nr:response regulator [Defluviitaleaceae bacterium]
MTNTIMAIDDVPENLIILEAILQDNYHIVTADGGATALKLLKEGPEPDLILLDLSMPEMDGFQFLEKIREVPAYNKIPVIFVTGSNDVYSEEKGLDLGAVDYIKKPYEPKIIRVKIRNHIELKTYRDNLSEAVAIRTRQLEERTEELYAAHSAIIMGMALLSESRDKVTGSHIVRIKGLTHILASKVCEWYPAFVSPELVEIITTYSSLHDVGKVSVPDSVLMKKGKLTEKEFDEMKGHTHGGGDLLRQISELLPHDQSHISIAIEIAESHHERFDGTGYPKNISGENIPISARIVALADVYDALRSTRPYKEGFTHEQALDIITNGDGRTDPKHFDPIVLRAFKEVHEEMRDLFDKNPDPYLELQNEIEVV